MNVRIALLALAASFVVSSPASAQDLNPWGVWGEGSQMKKSKAVAAKPIGSASGLGASGLQEFEPSDMQMKKAVQLASGGPKPSISPQAPQTVSFSGYAPGTVVIDTAGRKLYYVKTSTTAYRYPIAVGKAGFAWSGTQKVSRIANWPDWTPPAEMRQRKPHLPMKMTGGLNNPLGAKAIYLGSTLYRIHGTNDTGSIGTASSSGCIRMHNGQVVHLAGLIGPGTTVKVLRGLPKNVAKAKGGESI